MKTSHIYLRLALGAWSLTLGASAQECETTSELDPETGTKILRVTSPDQLTIFEGCTSITGNILIEHEYEGDFILNGVTDFAGNISTPVPANPWWWRPDSENLPPDSEFNSDYLAADIKLFDLRDLVYVENIVLYGLSGDAILPKLETAGDIVLVQASSSAEVDLGSLVEAENVRVQGSWTSINAARLKKVNRDAQFCGSQGCGIYPDEEFPTLTVELPSLETANSFEVAGTVKSASVPELQVIGTHERALYVSQGLRINIQEGGEELDFDAPKLHTLNGTLEVYGGVSSVSLGALGDTTISATINARAELDFYSTIKTASNFYVWGVLHSIYLPDMVDLGSVNLAYEPVLPCNETLYRLYEAQGSTGSNDPAICTRPDVPDDPETPGDEDLSNDEDTNNDTSDDTANDDTTNNSPSSDEDTDNNVDNSNDTTTPGSSDDSSESSPNNQDSSSDDTSSADDSYIPGDGSHQTIPLPSFRGLVLFTVGMISVCLY
ncbi:hypothetical protein BDV12DRAFT_175058 [Aspergillus spectabilis]